MPSQDWWIVFKTKKEGDAPKQLSGEMKELKQGLTGAVEGLTGLSIGSLGAAAVITGLAVEAKKSVDRFVNYTDEVRNMERATGTTAEESSRMIQTMDDLKVSTGDLEVALKFANKNGITPNIENLAKMSDEYLKLAPGTERNSYLLKEFGKNGLTMAEAMEQGGDKLRALAAAQSGNLILTQKQVDAGREYEKSLDALQDRMKGYTVVIGGTLVKAFTGALDIADKFFGFLDDEILGGKWQKQSDQIRKNSTSYEDYRKKIEETITVTGAYINAEGDLVKVLHNSYGIREQVIQQNYSMTKGMWDAATALVDYGDDFKKEAIAAGVFKLAIEDVSGSQDILKQKMIDLKTEMAGSIGKENANYIKSYLTLNGELQTTQSKMQELLQIKGPWTPEQQTAYFDLMSAQDALKAKIAEVEENHRKAMAQFVLDNMIAKMSIDGPLTQAETDFAMDFAEKQGLIDEATRTSMRQVDGYIDKLAKDVPPSYDGWKKYQDDINGKLDTANGKIDDVKGNLASIKDKTVTITVKTVNSSGAKADGGADAPIGGSDGSGSDSGRGLKKLASGGSFVIPAGYANDSYPLAGGHVMVSSGETVTVTPAGRGGGITIQNVNIASSMDLESFKRMLLQVMGK